MHTSVSNHVALAFGENQQLDAAQYHEMLKGMEGIYFAKGAVEFSDEEIPSKTQEDFDEAFIAAAEKTYEAKEQEVTTPIMRELERVIMLRVVDEYWMDHIDAMDDLKQASGSRATATTTPWTSTSGNPWICLRKWSLPFRMRRSAACTPSG